MSILSRLDPAFLRRVASTLAGRRREYGDLFLERSAHAEITLDGRGPGASVSGLSEGCAVRLFDGDRARHHARASLEPEAVEALGRIVRGIPPAAPPPSGQPVGAGAFPLAGPEGIPADGIARYLEEIETAARGAAGGVAFAARAETRVQEIVVATSEGEVAEDRRAWVAFSARLAGDGPEASRGPAVSEGGGARDLERLRALHPPRRVAGNLEQALEERRGAIPPPSGETVTVLAPGLGGILFHEACGHALEGDRALKGRSALVDLLGEQVGPAGLTIVDDPTMDGLPGSRRVDDEGWPVERTVLVDSGRVAGLLLDRTTAILAGTAPTGSARRESYRDLPLPRMSNTFVLEGTHDPEEIVSSVARGVYIAELGSGEVDTVTADFSFRVRRGYVIAAGRIVAPLAPCVVSGNGVDVLRNIGMIGVDLKFDPGAGVCGKDGQVARAAVGQPTIKVAGLSVRPAVSGS